jgi:hypothetical protein
MAEKAKKVRVWSIPGGNATIKLDQESVIMAAGSNVFVAVDKNGITLRGNISEASMGPGQRTGGFFVKMPEFANMIPKTIVTPIPMLVPFPPLGMILGIIAGVSIGIAFLSM